MILVVRLPRLGYEFAACAGFRQRLKSATIHCLRCHSEQQRATSHYRETNGPPKGSFRPAQAKECHGFPRCRQRSNGGRLESKKQGTGRWVRSRRQGFGLRAGCKLIAFLSEGQEARSLLVHSTAGPGT